MTTYSVRPNRARLPVGRGILLALTLFALLGAIYTYALQDENGPPPGFELAEELDLSSRPYTAETVLEFTLDEPANVGIYYALTAVHTAYLELSLQPPAGESMVVLRSEDFRTDEQGGGLWEQPLAAGTYRLLLTAPQSQGRLSIYWGYP